MSNEREQSKSAQRQAAVNDIFPPSVTLTSDFGGAAYDGTALMQQQFWLWEKDSENIGSNLLVEYGFVRSTPPQQEWGARCYEFDLENSGRIRLWSFGVMYCDPKHGAVFLQGPSYTPKLVGAKHAIVPAWVPEQILSPRTPRLPADGKKMAHLMPPLLAWMGSYERWMLDTIGLDYRRGCVEKWEAPVCDAEKLPAEWWSLAAKWREYLAHA